MFETPERKCTDPDYMSLFRKFIDDNLVQIERLRQQMQYSDSAKEQLGLANRQGGSRHRMSEASNEAVLAELMWRDKLDWYEIARANTVEGARFRNDVGLDTISKMVRC